MQMMRNVFVYMPKIIKVEHNFAKLLQKDKGCNFLADNV